MNKYNLNCSKCSSEMEDGFIVDFGYANVQPSGWVEGEPVKSRWHGIKINDKKQYSITTFRCVRCGYLESYATEEKQKDSLFT